MPDSRRQFLAKTSLGLLAAAVSRNAEAQEPSQLPPAERDRFVRTNSDPGPLPSNDADIAFAPVTKLSRWIEHRELTSERLTHTYLNRIEQFDPRLRSVITLTRDLALAQAKKADAE